MTKKARRRRFDPGKYVLNCVPSVSPETDWTMADAVEAGAVKVPAALPKMIDLREPWWGIRDQAETGACVGFACADGALRWHYVKQGLIRKTDRVSPRFIWMANKETDDLCAYPTTFIESAGTQTKYALRVARNFGCVLEADLPMKGGLATLSVAAFYTKAARLRIATYHNLGTDPDTWRKWLANQGPILTRLNVDRTWDRATDTRGKLGRYQASMVRGGHAVSLVGYRQGEFIVRNSWSTTWGDKGFAYASADYAAEAFKEAYGVVI